MSIPLPSLDEQERVIERLDQLFRFTTQIKSMVSRTDMLMQALMNALVDGEAPRVALREVLVPVKRPESLEQSTTYKLLGMRWYADGLFVKDQKPGAEVAAKTLYRVQEADFVYNRLFAWKGSFGLVDRDLSGSYVSGEYPTFEINTEQVDPRYLMSFFRKSSTWEEAERRSRGSTPTSRNRLKEEQFLAMDIPLPSMPVQVRVAQRISKLLGAQSLRREHQSHLGAAEASMLNDVFVQTK